MKINRSDIEEKGYGETWQYFCSVYNSFEAMRASYHMINACLDKRKSNFKGIVEGKSEISENEKMSLLPGDIVCIDGINMSISFIINMNLQSFFQFGRNSFDYMSQVIAAIFCKDLNIYNVDFQKLILKEERLQNEEVRKFIIDISQSENYKYLCDFNNIVKHNYYPQILISMRVDSLDFIGKIPAFSKGVKKDEVHLYDEENVKEKIKKIYDFTLDTFDSLLKIIMPEKEI